MKLIIQLETLTCPSCMQKIEQGLGRQAGVEKVEVLFNASKVKVAVQPEIITPESVQQTIEALGYEVKNIKITEPA